MILFEQRFYEKKKAACEAEIERLEQSLEHATTDEYVKAMQLITRLKYHIQAIDDRSKKKDTGFEFTIQKNAGFACYAE